MNSKPHFHWITIARKYFRLPVNEYYSFGSLLFVSHFECLSQIGLNSPWNLSASRSQCCSILSIELLNDTMKVSTPKFSNAHNSIPARLFSIFVLWFFCFPSTKHTLTAFTRIGLTFEWETLFTVDFLCQCLSAFTKRLTVVPFLFCCFCEKVTRFRCSDQIMMMRDFIPRLAANNVFKSEKLTR